jgi:uncharacterized protein (TIGR00290 family)
MDLEIMTEKIVLCWSGGKDSTQALYELEADPRHAPVALLATVTAEYGRLSLHGVRLELLERQAAALRIPLHPVFISRDGSNEEYEEKMRQALEGYQARGVRTIAFGDLYLEDVRRYREEKLLLAGMQGLFPLWGRDTGELARGFLARGFKAVITCVDTHVLPKDFVGREYDHRFLADLPPGVDPCGENGEFHSFVYDGPLFSAPVPFTLGQRLLTHDRFYFCDLVPC